MTSISSAALSSLLVSIVGLVLSLPLVTAESPIPGPPCLAVLMVFDQMPRARP